MDMLLKANADVSVVDKVCKLRVVIVHVVVVVVVVKMI